MAGFFSFKKMVTVPFVRIIYLLGFLGINLYALVLLLNRFILNIITIPEIEFLGRHPLLWPILFLAIHLLWRLFCEGVLIVFRIYETLVSIESEMKKGGVVELTETVETEPPPGKIRSRKEFKKWWSNRKLRRASINKK
jgi:hypothetical protein